MLRWYKDIVSVWGVRLHLSFQRLNDKSIGLSSAYLLTPLLQALCSCHVSSHASFISHSHIKIQPSFHLQHQHHSTTLVEDCLVDVDAMHCVLSIGEYQQPISKVNCRLVQGTREAVGKDTREGL